MTTTTDPDPAAATATARAGARQRPLPRFLRVLHWVLIANFAINIAYGAFQLFVVLTPAGGAVGPLFGAAKGMSTDLLLARRAYAQEIWITISGLAVYLGVTEYLPRLLRRDA